MTSSRPARAGLAHHLRDALDHDLLDPALGATEPLDHRDELEALAIILGLHTGPVDRVRHWLAHQHHPVVASLKSRLEARFLVRVDHATATLPVVAGGAVTAMRQTARATMLPDIYRWVANDAGRGELVEFLSLEGGPDASFDDLVALCQVGLSGRPKLVLADNYWDEMGRGSADGVHTTLHDRMVVSLGITSASLSEQPISGLERMVLNDVLATNRSLQPELVGALGLLELQAGPRCRQVVDGLHRLGADEDALAFYREHAHADPRHGKVWLDGAVAELARDPWWSTGIIRGARWRAAVNQRFFDDMATHFGVERSLQAA
jgi:hypothetical protein